MLLFKKKFLDAIRTGEKTQTIRVWEHRRMRTGQRSYIPGVGAIQVELVEAVEISALTDADARPDGFENAAQMVAELRAIYGDELDRQQAYRVLFRRCKTDE